MKDKIIDILSNSSKSLSATEIMNLINENYSTDELKTLLELLNSLYKEGIIYQNKDNNYLLFENSHLLKGYIEINASGSGFLLQETEDVYIPFKYLNNANDGDFVVVELSKTKGRRKEGRVVRILKRSLGSSLAEVCLSNGKLYLKLLDEKYQNYNLEIEKNDLNLVEGLIVKVEIVNEINRKDFLVRIVNVVGHKNSPDIDILKICSEFNIETEFNEKVLEEVKCIPNEIDESDTKNRVDLRNEMIFTIDGADTKDIDDAISIKKLDNGNYELGVHIADVSYYVKEGSELKNTAFNRGNSVYLADRVIPMLPVELSNGICSLNENSDRFAFSCIMEINNKGEIVSHNIFKSIINSKKKMTYDNVNKLFNGNIPKGYEEFKDTLLLMKELYEILEDSSIKKGKLDFISDEVKLKVDDKGKVLEVSKYETGVGQKLIENFMIAANTTVGTYIYNMALPFVYRVHGLPEAEKLRGFVSYVSLLGYKLIGKSSFENIKPIELQSIMKQLEDKKEYKYLNNKLLRCMQKAEYSPYNIGHFGLALDSYSHFTSPIRRFSDLMVHYFLNEYLVNNNYNKDFIDNWNNRLPYICEHISKTERTADDCEREVNDMKIAEYMESHIGDIYEATIDGCLSKGFFVVTDNLISGLVSLDTLNKYYEYNEELEAYLDKKKRVVYRAGDRVTVICIGASKEKRQVDFTIYEGDKNGNC